MIICLEKIKSYLEPHKFPFYSFPGSSEDDQTIISSRERHFQKRIFVLSKK